MNIVAARIASALNVDRNFALAGRGYFTGVQQFMVDGEQHQFEFTLHFKPLADFEEAQAERVLAQAEKAGPFRKRVSRHG